MFLGCRRSLNLFIFYAVASAPIRVFFFKPLLCSSLPVLGFLFIISYLNFTSSSINDDLLFPNIFPLFKSRHAAAAHWDVEVF